MKRIMLGLTVVIFVVPVAAKQMAPSVELVKGDNRINVMINGKLFTSYVYGSELTKPVLVPVRTPSGIEVNRRHPMVKIKGASTDHPHHVGIFFAVDQVN